MNLLALDSSSSILSVAVCVNDKIFYAQEKAGLKYSELLMEYIDNLMKEASLKPSDLNAVLCTAGPGSFTGLRIGYSAAKGLALSLSIPFVPVPTLDCISFFNDEQENKNCEIILAVTEARKNAWFYAFYRFAAPGSSLPVRLSADKDGEKTLILEELKQFHGKIILKGPGSGFLFDALGEEARERIIHINENRGYSKEILYIAKIRNLLDNDNTGYLYSGPQYLRLPDAFLEKNGII